MCGSSSPALCWTELLVIAQRFTGIESTGSTGGGSLKQGGNDPTAKFWDTNRIPTHSHPPNPAKSCFHPGSLAKQLPGSCLNFQRSHYSTLILFLKAKNKTPVTVLNELAIPPALNPAFPPHRQMEKFFRIFLIKLENQSFATASRRGPLLPLSFPRFLSCGRNFSHFIGGKSSLAVSSTWSWWTKSFAQSVTNFSLLFLQETNQINAS